MQGSSENTDDLLSEVERVRSAARLRQRQRREQMTTEEREAQRTGRRQSYRTRTGMVTRASEEN